jgi:hypothetical protein
MRTLSFVFILMVASAVAGLAQDAPPKAVAADTLNARDIFWSSADLVAAKPKTQGKTTTKTQAKNTTTTGSPTVGTSTSGTPTVGTGSSVHTASVTGQLGLRYTILKALPGGGQMEVLPDTAFKAHDAIRLSIESNKTGYLYIIQQGSSGTWTPLYPEQGKQHEIQPGKEYIVPSEGGSFEFDEHAGQERLFVLLSQTPMHDLESLVTEAQRKGDDKAVSGADHSINEVISQIKLGSRDLVFTKADKDAPAAGAKEQDTAMYVVNKNADGKRVVVDMVLKHQ